MTSKVERAVTSGGVFYVEIIRINRNIRAVRTEINQNALEMHIGLCQNMEAVRTEVNE